MKFLGVFIEATSGICLGHNDDVSDQLKRGQSWFVETLWLEFIPTFTQEKKKKEKKITSPLYQVLWIGNKTWVLGYHLW